MFFSQYKYLNIFPIHDIKLNIFNKIMVKNHGNKRIPTLRKLYDRFSNEISSCSSETSLIFNRERHRPFFDFLAGPGSSFGGIYIVDRRMG